MSVHSLTRIYNDFGLQNSALKTKVMAFHGADPIRANIVVDGTVIDQVSNFGYLGFNVSCITNNDLVKKLHKRGTIRGTLKITSKETRLKYYKKTFLTFLYGSGSENWT